MFGDKALLYMTSRFRNAIAKGVCEFWAINRSAYKRVLSQVSQSDYA